MRHRIAMNSRREGLAKSRLPVLSSKEIREMRGTMDFFSLNYYTSRLVSELTAKQIEKERIEVPSWEYDLHLYESASANWKHSQLHWLYSVPSGMGDILRWYTYNHIHVAFH